MRKTVLHSLWAAGLILCACLGFIQERTAGVQALLTALALLSFLPPALCLYFARKSSDQKEARLIRNLSALSLGLTLLGLLLAILTAPMGGSLASAVNLFLSIVSAPMYCSSSWAVPLFFWACLLLTGAKFGT